MAVAYTDSVDDAGSTTFLHVGGLTYQHLPLRPRPAVPAQQRRNLRPLPRRGTLAAGVPRLAVPEAFPGRGDLNRMRNRGFSGR